MNAEVKSSPWSTKSLYSVIGEPLSSKERGMSRVIEVELEETNDS